MAILTLPSLSSVTLSLTILLSSYTTYRAGTPPNPIPYNSTQPDSYSKHVTPQALFTRRFFNLSLSFYHILLVLTYPFPPSAICPHPNNLSSYSFDWNALSIFSLAIILLGGWVRLSAFSALGKDFTFRLATPQKLTTTGLYSYMQHPSYTGKALIVLGNATLMQRPSGPVGCLLPYWIVNATWFWRAFVVLAFVGVNRTAWKRIIEEEAMLKKEFGREWEVWHRKTKRLVPGVV